MSTRIVSFFQHLNLHCIGVSSISFSMPRKPVKIYINTPFEPKVADIIFEHAQTQKRRSAGAAVAHLTRVGIDHLGLRKKGRKS